MRIILVAILALAVSGCVTPGGGLVASGPEGTLRRERIEWSPDTKKLYIALAFTRAADVALTHQAIKSGCIERNPLYGERPSLGKLIGISAFGLAMSAWATESSVQAGRNPNTGLKIGIGVNGLVIGWNLTQIGGC